MQSKYENFGEARAVVKDYDLGVPLYGSLDLAINNYDLYDNFGVLDLGLPEHDRRSTGRSPTAERRNFTSFSSVTRKEATTRRKATTIS